MWRLIAVLMVLGGLMSIGNGNMNKSWPIESPPEVDLPPLDPPDCDPNWQVCAPGPPPGDETG